MKRLSFNSEGLAVDWITFKFPFLESAQQEKIVNYLFEIGFNCYYEFGKLAHPQKEVIKEAPENKFEVLFIKNGDYWDGTLLHFSGKNAAHFYKSVREKKIDFQIFSSGILSRFDLHYNLETFINSENLDSFFQDCQSSLQLNVGYEKNKRGQILKIGSRRSNRYSRVYSLNNQLRFEHEMKGRFIQGYSQLLMEEDLEGFEQGLSERFLVYFGKYLPMDSNYLTWLAVKLRSMRPQPLASLMFKTDSIGLVNTVDQKKKLIRFLHFLVYAKELDYKVESLGSTSYRCVTFRLSEFLRLQKPNLKEVNTHQVDKFRKFFKELQTGFLVSLFSNERFQSLVSVPKVELWKENHSWVCKVWVVEELFYYNYPFSLPNIFHDELSQSEFLVRFEVLKIFSSPDVEKEFSVTDFIKSYPSSLSNKSIKQIKEFFIESVEILQQESLIQPRFQIIRDGRIESVNKLTYQNISEGFIIYERVVPIEPDFDS